MTWYERHPRLTLGGAAALLLLACDLAAGALAARLAGPPGATAGALTRYVGAVEVHEHRVASPAFHHGFRPLDRFVADWGAARVEVITNSLALRDGAPRTIDPARRGRLLLLGDSFVEGVGVPWEETFAGLLAARLAPRGIEVLDAGVAGYSPKLYYWKLRWLLDVARLHVDDLVVFVDASDPHNEIEYETWEPAGEEAAGWTDGPGRLARWSFTARVVQAAAHRLRFGTDEARLELLQQLDRELYDFQAPAVAARWGDHGVELCEQYLQRIADLCRARGIRLRLAVHPSSIHVRAGDRSEDWVERWCAFAARNQLPCVDYFAVFLDAKLLGRVPPPPPGITPWLAVERAFYIQGDVHWNAAGHQVVAARLLEEKGWPW